MTDIWAIGQEGGVTRPINRDILFRNLSDVYDVFQKHGIKCWLSHGTMLGAYRDGNFIPWDDDADLGADIGTAENRLAAEEELRSMGYFVPPLGDRTKPVDPESNMPYSDTVAIKDGEKIEVWWYEKQGDKYVYDVYRQPPCLHHEEKYYDTLVDFTFRGKSFKIPNLIEDWIVMMYGGDWQRPIPGRKYNNS